MAMRLIAHEAILRQWAALTAGSPIDATTLTLEHVAQQRAR